MNANLLSILSIVAPIIGDVLPAVINRKNSTDDGYVEAVKEIGKKAGLDLDTKHASAAILIAEELVVAASDGTITVSEIIKVVEDLCKELGVNFDKTGLQVTDHGVEASTNLK